MSDDFALHVWEYVKAHPTRGIPMHEGADYPGNDGRPLCARCRRDRDGTNGGPLIFDHLPVPDGKDRGPAWACWECRAELAWSWDLPRPKDPYKTLRTA
jgi:hypothetical protein